MAVERYWTILIKQWRLILGCFLLMGLGAFVASRLMTPLYQSTSVVQIAINTGNNSADYNNLLASDQLVQTEAELAVSDPVLRQVATHFPGVTSDLLYKETSSTPELNTQLFQITVLDASPLRAAAIANDIAATLIKQQLQVVEQNNILAQRQIQQDLDSTQQQINSTTNKIASLQARGGNQGQLVVLQAQLSSLQQHYTQWQTVLAQLELTQAENGDFIRVAQAAQPGYSPVRPNILLNTGAGLFVGLFLGMLLAIVFEQVDTRVRNADMLSQLLDWPVLATIWLTRQVKKGVMINPQERDPNVESYRILRTNVGFSGIDKPIHSIMVTSAMPGDGKSTVAANLAIYMAKAGKNTLLIDGDLRRPTQHELFDLSAEKKGLSNAVLTFSAPAAAYPPSGQFAVPISPVRSATTSDAANVSLEPFMHAVGIPNLRVMPSGPLPPNPSELLDSKAMQRLFHALTNCGAEVVIFDAPPIRGLSDTSILASKVDGTILVVDVSRANKNHLKQVKTLITQAGAHVLGCVINKQRISRHDTSYSYQYYYRHDDQNHRGPESILAGASSTEPAHVFGTARNIGRVPLLEKVEWQRGQDGHGK